jgi:hypothetical protein
MKKVDQISLNPDKVLLEKHVPARFFEPFPTTMAGSWGE